MRNKGGSLGFKKGECKGWGNSETGITCLGVEAEAMKAMAVAAPGKLKEPIGAEVGALFSEGAQEHGFQWVVVDGFRTDE
jgi:hypothetical protein